MIVTPLTISAQDDGGSQYEGDPDFALPEFPTNLEWLNVESPLTVESLRGKIVVFDFWTYGCINCIHMIPVLAQLEAKYPEELIVIGVHSAKFQNEGQTDNLRQIVERYDLHHPIINDKDFILWRMYGANGWPTFMIADPRGNILAAQSGEIPFEAFDQLIAGMIDHFNTVGEINRDPIDLALEGAGTPSGLLAFPGKVMVDEDGGRLFIADSNHHRIVIADLETYEVLDVIGTGQRGYVDGDFATVQFNQPQGMALDGDILYVADTNNHAIRALNLTDRTAETIAGDGERGRGVPFFDTEISDPLSFAIRSPWDVTLGDDHILYIAMAGTHQIWQLNLDTNILQATVGDGREAMLNATLADSELAQPSGLYFTDGQLYFADSESSTVRVADLADDRVETIAGTTDNNLFDFGDIDGELGVSRLQHALGVTGSPDGLIYIADTYNSKIKVVDENFETQTLSGQAANGGYADGDLDAAQFDEPGGIDYADGKLYVADTNNHAIRVIDLETDTVSTIAFPNPEALQIAEQVTIIGGNAASGEILSLPTQTVSAGDGRIVLQLTIPDGYKLNNLTTSFADWSSDDEAIDISESQMIIDALEVSVPATLNEGEGVLNGDLTIYFCEAERESLCFIDTFKVELPVTVNAEGDSHDLIVERDLIPPDLDSDIGGIGG
jgi:DNA-binding beta-propeller fold protein YncE